MIAGILRPNIGSVRVLDTDVSSLSERAARAFRVSTIGLVFQDFELLDYLTAEENILLPYRVTSGLGPMCEARARVAPLAERTGITHLLADRPDNLSQGERQRVAICRALVTEPRLVLADEPTGSLDPTNQDRVVALLRETAMAAEAGLLMVTHDHELLDRFDRVIDLPSARAGEDT